MLTISTFHKAKRATVINTESKHLNSNPIPKEEEMAEEALKLLFHMNGGTGKSSYAENSSHQRLVMEKSKHIMEESIRELLFQYCSDSLPKCVYVADLGCSSGPNAFFTVKEIIRSVTKTCWQQQPNCQLPSIQVLFNDLIGNDFNTLFKELPKFYDELERSDIGGEGKNRSCCYIGAMPGSFYGRLFPNHSIHFVHSSYSLHWLSQVPLGLMSKSGESLNKRNIYIAETSCPIVREAYMNQFENDFTTFLRMRSQELVSKGHLVLTFICKNDKDDGYDYWELLGHTLHDMVSMGLIEEGQLATFNIPIHQPSIKELKRIIEVEGSFALRRLETFKLNWDENNNIIDGHPRGMYVAKCIRAVLESLLVNHFGENIMNDLFEMYDKNVAKYVEKGKGIVNNVTLQLVKDSN